ncbi:MAG: hypothetical protein ACI845_004094 [Gammaproteobacteria bacterium]|jgi:hypothetical protein
MNKSINKSTLLGVVIYFVLVLVCIFLFTASKSAVELQNAIELRDADLAMRYLSIKSIQKSISDQLSSKLLDTSVKMNSELSDSDLGLAEISLALNVINHYTETYISRAGIEQMFQLSSNLETMPENNKVSRIYSSLKSKNFIAGSSLQFISPLKLKASGRDNSNREYKFIFELKSYRWVLTDILLDMNSISTQDIIDYLSRFSDN